MAVHNLPRVMVFGLGGTIAMARGQDGTGAIPQLSAEMLLAAVPQVSLWARVEACSFRNVPSPHLTLDDVAELARAIDQASLNGFDGIVVTQGTDAIEETAFALDLLVQSDVPVAVTGAMRHSELPGADGPANLLAAVQVAASPLSRDIGTVVVFQDEIHAARFVRKVHTTSLGAFRSPSAGPIGYVTEGRVRMFARPGRRVRVDLAPGKPDVPVALVTAALGDDGRFLDALPDLGYGGVVVEGFGAGHTSPTVAERLGRLAQVMPVVLASRTGAGEVLRGTYGYTGSESDLLRRGLIPAGILDGPKARILLACLLRAGVPRNNLVNAYEAFLDWSPRTGASLR
ncbi:MAG: asparaginase [Firmicutes bacterium]|nr:asparaginase [Bacillota bacterium]